MIKPKNVDTGVKGLLRVSKKCKICQSPFLNEITTVLLEGVMTYQEIIDKWGSQIPNGLSGTNIHSHKMHCDPRKAAEIEVKKRELSLTDFTPAVVGLYQQKYDETLNKIKTVNLLYDARIRNLWELLALKKNLEDKPESEKSLFYKKDIQELTTAIDEIMKGLTKDLLNHMKLEQGPGVVNINVVMIQNFKEGIQKFIEDFIDVLIEEIDDPIIRDRVKERFIEKLDEKIAPLLNPKNMVIADAKIIDTKEEEE